MDLLNMTWVSNPDSIFLVFFYKRSTTVFAAILWLSCIILPSFFMDWKPHVRLFKVNK